mgnify:CR=1 FL=1
MKRLGSVYGACTRGVQRGVMTALLALVLVGVVSALPQMMGKSKASKSARELFAKNTGIIASFSRALLEDLRHQMTDAEFDASLAAAIDEIYTGSTQKTLVAA